MSQLYKVEVDVTPLEKAEDIATVGDLLGKLGLSVDDSGDREEGTICFWGDMSLSAMSPDERHAEILKALREARGPEVHIETRWLNMDVLEWDEIINSQDEGDE